MTAAELNLLMSGKEWSLSKAQALLASLPKIINEIAASEGQKTLSPITDEVLPAMMEKLNTALKEAEKARLGKPQPKEDGNFWSKSWDGIVSGVEFVWDGIVAGSTFVWQGIKDGAAIIIVGLVIVLDGVTWCGQIIKEGAEITGAWICEKWEKAKNAIENFSIEAKIFLWEIALWSGKTLLNDASAALYGTVIGKPVSIGQAFKGDLLSMPVALIAVLLIPTNGSHTGACWGIDQADLHGTEATVLGMPFKYLGHFPSNNKLTLASISHDQAFQDAAGKEFWPKMKAYSNANFQWVVDAWKGPVNTEPGPIGQIIRLLGSPVFFIGSFFALF